MTVHRPDGSYVSAEVLRDAVTHWEEEQPDAVAVRANDSELTFADLAGCVRDLAAVLTSAGVTADTSVAIATGRSCWSVVALLATWWSGGCAVLLDDRYPSDRIAACVRDAGASLLVGTQSDLTVPVRQIPPEAKPDVPALPTAPTTRPDDLAYIVYTSGTTGRPKGVEVTFRCLDAFLSGVAALRLPPGGWGVSAVSPAFDGWLWCVLLYLLHGQGLAWLDPQGEADLGAAIATLRPATVSLTPSLLAACDLTTSDVPVLVVAGEPCPKTLVDWYATGRRMINVYGPTETTIAATWSDNAAGDDLGTIGRPLSGYHVHVVDDLFREVADGETGELCVGGPALARGYRGMPALTASRFVPDPFDAVGSRMYLTGDLVRPRADGQLVYVGRRDDQLKVRGYRIEPAEVERVILDDPAIASACCVELTNQSLGLAVVAAPGFADVDVAERALRCCRQALPEFMVPSVVTRVESLPFSTTGKVDRASLATTLVGRFDAHATMARDPRSDSERMVLAVWNELLPAPVQDLDADFFDIGGHSLLAAKAVAALRRRSGIALSMQDFMAAPTVAGLATGMDRRATGR